MHKYGQRAISEPDVKGLNKYRDNIYKFRLTFPTTTFIKYLSSVEFTILCN